MRVVAGHALAPRQHHLVLAHQAFPVRVLLVHQAYPGQGRARVRLLVVSFQLVRVRGGVGWVGCGLGLGLGSGVGGKGYFARLPLMFIHFWALQELVAHDAQPRAGHGDGIGRGIALRQRPVKCQI